MTIRMFLLLDLPSGLLGFAIGAAFIAERLLAASNLSLWPF